MKTLDPYRRNIYSQQGEDGVIEEILKRTGITTGRSVEFGAWDGKYLSNTYNLLTKGWSSVFIEADPARFAGLKAIEKEFPGRVVSICKRVDYTGPDTLDNILAAAKIFECDLLSIDIDSYDWHVWHATKSVQPKVVLIEINSALKPGIRQIHQGSAAISSSFTSTLELGRSKGYTLACHTGNMIFVRNDLVGRIGLTQAELDFPEILFDYYWFQYRGALKTKIAKRIQRLLRIDIDHVSFL